MTYITRSNCLINQVHGVVFDASFDVIDALLQLADQSLGNVQPNHHILIGKGGGLVSAHIGYRIPIGCHMCALLFWWRSPAQVQCQRPLAGKAEDHHGMAAAHFNAWASARR